MKKLIIAFLIMAGASAYADKVQFCINKVSDDGSTTNQSTALTITVADSANLFAIYGTNTEAMATALLQGISEKLNDAIANATMQAKIAEAQAFEESLTPIETE